MSEFIPLANFIKNNSGYSEMFQLQSFGKSQARFVKGFFNGDMMITDQFDIDDFKCVLVHYYYDKFDRIDHRDVGYIIKMIGIIFYDKNHKLLASLDVVYNTDIIEEKNTMDGEFWIEFSYTHKSNIIIQKIKNIIVDDNIIDELSLLVADMIEIIKNE